MIALSQVSFCMDGGRVAYIAAHELGHGLNAKHDGRAECPVSDENIMIAIPAYTIDITYAEAQWTFSNCSVESFKLYINR